MGATCPRLTQLCGAFSPSPTQMGIAMCACLTRGMGVRSGCNKQSVLCRGTTGLLLRGLQTPGAATSALARISAKDLMSMLGLKVGSHPELCSPTGSLPLRAPTSTTHQCVQLVQHLQQQVELVRRRGEVDEHMPAVTRAGGVDDI